MFMAAEDELMGNQSIPADLFRSTLQQVSQTNSYHKSRLLHLHPHSLHLRKMRKYNCKCVVNVISCYAGPSLRISRELDMPKCGRTLLRHILTYFDILSAWRILTYFDIFWRMRQNMSKYVKMRQAKNMAKYGMQLLSFDICGVPSQPTLLANVRYMSQNCETLPITSKGCYSCAQGIWPWCAELLKPETCA